MGARAGLGSGCGSLRPRSIRSGHGPRTRRRRGSGRRRRAGLHRGRGGPGPVIHGRAGSGAPSPRAPPRGRRGRGPGPGAPSACESPPPGGVVLVMSPGLALRQAGSQESSAGGFRRAGLARREAGWTASRWARITQVGPGPRRIRPRAAGYAPIRNRPHTPGVVAGPGSSLLVRCYFDQVVMAGGTGRLPVLLVLLSVWSMSVKRRREAWEQVASFAVLPPHPRSAWVSRAGLGAGPGLRNASSARHDPPRLAPCELSAT